jgi:regulator of sigma E protease
LSAVLENLVSTNGLLIGTILPFLFVLVIVVFVHEMGHYLVGRWCGIGVRAFSIGLGPEVFGFNDRHGTRWKLCAVPLGGYVKFVGDMNATSTPDPKQMEQLTAEEKKIAFHNQPVWKRAATVFAGPAFNFLLTIAVFTVVFASYGRYVFEPTIAQVQAGSPAEKAGFLPGDRFLSVDGHAVETFDDVQSYVTGRAGDPIVFVIARGEQQLTLTATPEVREIENALGKMKMGVIGVVQTADTCRSGGSDRAHCSKHGPLPETAGRRARGSLPARRPDQDRRHGGEGRERRLGSADPADRVSVGGNRYSEPAADSPAGWRASGLLRDRGSESAAGFGADHGSRL